MRTAATSVIGIVARNAEPAESDHGRCPPLRGSKAAIDVGCTGRPNPGHASTRTRRRTARRPPRRRPPSTADPGPSGSARREQPRSRVKEPRGSAQAPGAARRHDVVTPHRVGPALPHGSCPRPPVRHPRFDRGRGDPRRGEAVKPALRSLRSHALAYTSSRLQVRTRPGCVSATAWKRGSNPPGAGQGRRLGGHGAVAPTPMAVHRAEDD